MPTQVLTYIDVSAVSEGISDQFAFYLLSIANACSAVGRITGGLAADRLGPSYLPLSPPSVCAHQPTPHCSQAHST